MINKEALPILSDLASRLRWARKNAGLSQQRLAEISCYTQKQISNLESGVTVRPRNLTKLANTLNISPSWLMFGHQEIDDLDKQSIEVALKFNRLSQTDRNTLESIINRFDA